MIDVKCTCGHTNPPSTSICEACGNPFETNSDGLLNMRYEGMSRRSQMKPQGVLDLVWNFFSSVKVAVWMIVITLFASIIGTILPQEQFKQSNLPAETYYSETYGWFGKLYFMLGFHNLFYSWWFILLLLMIGISLVICSIDRVVPLYKALHRQRIPKHLDFYRRQRLYAELSTDENAIDQFEEALKKRKYKVKRSQEGMLAEKGRISRWGPYINHIGLILLILAFLLRLIPGFYLDEFVWVWEDETKPVPGTGYYVKNEEFIMELYSEEEYPQKLNLKSPVVKNYQTNAILYEKVNGELKEVYRDSIRVNHPLEYNGLNLYQSGNRVNQLYSMVLKLVSKKDSLEIGEFELNLYDPAQVIVLKNDYKIKVLEYYPDFALNEDNEPYSKTRQPNNPAFVLQVFAPDVPQGEKGWVIPGIDADDITPDNHYRFDFSNLIFKDRTGLMVRIDKSLPYIYVSCGIVVVGLVMGFYWQHRRIWLRYENGRIILAAHTNKNWFGLKKEIERVVVDTGLNIPLEIIDQGGKKK